MYVTSLTTYSLHVRELQLNLKIFDYNPVFTFTTLSWEHECISASCSLEYM